MTEGSIMRKVSAKKLIVPILAAVLLLFSLPVNAAELSQTERKCDGRSVRLCKW